MKTKIILIIFIFGIFTSLWSQNDNIYIYHQAVEGETFKSLEKIYGVSQDAIREANPNLSWTLKDGESVRIPYQKTLISNDISSSKKTNFNSDTVFYEVKPKETLYGISQQFHVSIEQLISANPFLKEGLKAGQKIVIPNKQNIQQEKVTSSENGNTSNKHTVKAGETMYSIAKNYRVCLDSLQYANPQIINNNISAGTVLNIPVYLNPNNFIHHQTDDKEKVTEIAFNYQIPIQDLKKANPNISKVVQQGETVKIPVSPYEEQKVYKQEVIEIPVAVDDTIQQTVKNLCSGEWNTETTLKIALMMPFKFDQFNNSESNHESLKNTVDYYPSFTYFQFYQSVILALENLTDNGLHFELYVYDIFASDSKLDEILQKENLKSVDLIIGLLYKDPFSKVAEFAKNNNILLINVNSKRDDVVANYPNVIKVMPNLTKLAQAAVSILPDTLSNFNLLFFRHKDSIFNADENKLRSAISQKYEISNFSDSTIYGKNDIVKKLKKTKPNYIFVLSRNKAYVMDLLRILDKQKNDYEIHIIGYPDWNEMKDLDLSHVQNLNTVFITPFLIDYNDNKTVDFIYHFREKYNAEPDQFGYLGFDITNFFVEGLAKFGTEFMQCVNSIKYHPMTTEFQFENTTFDGYINNYWNIYKIENYEIIRLNNESN